MQLQPSREVRHAKHENDRGERRGLPMAASAFGQLKKDDIEKLNDAAAVLTEIRNAPDKGIPDGIWSKAHCVVVIPSMK